MQEFSSVTASSYDADSLAPMLNEKAADGWSVVSIVSAGTNIVAYLQRTASDQPAQAPSVEPAPALVVDEVVETVTVDEPVVETPAEPFIAAAAVTPVEEPAGWASAPEEPVADASVAELAAQVSEPVPTPEPEPVVQAAAPVESAVPAGWYADPSGRFELRYWDGAAWTEHVSRAGQQFTDPPVA